MTALAMDRSIDLPKWDVKEFTLASGNKAFKNARLGFNKSTGKVQLMSSTPGLLPIGRAFRAVDATSADKVCAVKIDRTLNLEWLANATAGNAVVSGDIGSLCFYLDDNTVTRTATGRSIAGRVWAVDATNGVLVEHLSLEPTNQLQPATGSYTANDYAPASIENGAIYDVPTTAAASTITLPAAAPDGTVAYFSADGTKNGHTVQYRDATGTVNLTTALTLSKRHLVTVAKRDGKWTANAYVAP